MGRRLKGKEKEILDLIGRMRGRVGGEIRNGGGKFFYKKTKFSNKTLDKGRKYFNIRS